VVVEVNGVIPLRKDSDIVMVTEGNGEPSNRCLKLTVSRVTLLAPKAQAARHTARSLTMRYTDKAVK
jgi:hypothetical protein